MEPEVRAGISTFALLPQDVVERALARLRDDLDSGAFWRRHDDLRERTEMDYAYRLLISDENT